MTTSKKQLTKIASFTTNMEQSVNSNLESFACVWLDHNVDSTEENIRTQKELRQLINHLRIFNDSNRCEQYIRQIKKEKVILIVSGSLGYTLVPRLHDLPQFSACYVYCHHQKRNEEWANKYYKVSGVFIDRSKLIAQISRDQQARTRLEDGASISVIASGSQSPQARNAIFMWFQLFIEVLLRMHHKSNDRNELLDICKRSYKGNVTEMEVINEFEQHYKSDAAIWWYTRESCFYRMMNKALRVQDFDMLFAYRFFISDIAKQIKNEHEKFIRTSDNRNIIHVYRGQMIGNVELDLMKKSIGQYLSMNSFLSTSRKRSIGLYFAQLTPKTGGLHRIIFEIQINPRLKTKAYADISQISFIQDEDEVLIMLGALFRIEKISEDKKDEIWIANVSLASEDDFELKEMFAYMKTTISDDADLGSLGEILIQMGEYEQARKCYRRMSKETQLATGHAKLNLGRVGILSNERGRTLEYLEEALRIRKKILGEKHPDVGECYNRIGWLYSSVEKDYDQALVNLKKAAEIEEATLPADSLALSKTYNSLAIVYSKMGKYDASLDYYMKCLKIQQKILPSDHHNIALTYNNLGTVYREKKNNTKALEYFKKSIQILHNTLPPSHDYVITVENNIRSLKTH